MCLDLELFENIKNIPSELICPIGKGVIDDPVCIHCSFAKYKKHEKHENNYIHIFCRECLTKTLQFSQKCPICRNPTSQNQITKVPYFNIYLSIPKLKCKNNASGCSWIGSLDKYNEHIDSCSYRQVKCKYIDCNELIFAYEMETHDKICNYKIINCNVCSGSYTVSNIFRRTELHTEIIPCDFCAVPYNRCVMETHQIICPEKEITCSHFLCLIRIKNKDMENHVKNECEYRSILCDHCNKPFYKCAKSEHIEKCQEKIIYCDIHGCEDSYKKKI